MKASATKVEGTINILILDDQPMWLETTKVNCELIFDEINRESESAHSKRKVEFYLCQTPAQAVHVLESVSIQIVFLDKDLGIDDAGKRLSGVDLISTFKNIQPFCQILMLTADSSPKYLAQAFRSGASDYLLKSSDEEAAEYRQEIIKRALTYYSQETAQAANLSSGTKRIYSRFVASSPAMQQFEHKLGAIAESTRPVLLLGETGLGKGAAARRINELSAVHLNQKVRPFTQINIGSTERALVEATLFGTEPGAYTGAHKKTKPGLLDIARGGDIFLDEIGDASPEIQLKLLKVIEEREYCRVGGTTPIKTSARFIFATNCDLHELVRQGKFRQDLYMRISVFEAALPALKERRSDIPEMVANFLDHALKEYPKKRITFQDLPTDLLNHFSRTQIPGNIRGIENDIFRLVALTPVNELGVPDFKNWRKYLAISGSRSTASDTLNYQKVLSTKFDVSDPSFPGLKELTSAIERRIFEDMKANGASVNQLAETLKISRNTVFAKLRDFGLSRKDARK